MQCRRRHHHRGHLLQDRHTRPPLTARQVYSSFPAPVYHLAIHLSFPCPCLSPGYLSHHLSGKKIFISSLHLGLCPLASRHRTREAILPHESLCRSMASFVTCQAQVDCVLRFTPCLIYSTSSYRARKNIGVCFQVINTFFNFFFLVMSVSQVECKAVSVPYVP